MYQIFVVYFLSVGLFIQAGLFAHFTSSSFQLKSRVFEDQASIPSLYTCEGLDYSPELSWSGAPRNTKSLALVCLDPDAPNKHFVHWLVYNIPANATNIPEGIRSEPQLADGSLQGTNDFRNMGYNGPCPPPGQTHSYVFTLYALDIKPDLKPGMEHEALQEVIKDHILASAELIGYFQAQSRLERQHTAPNPKILNKPLGDDPNAPQRSSYPD
jgi:hypothetical protein